MKTMHDNRKIHQMTQEEADELFKKIASLEATMYCKSMAVEQQKAALDLTLHQALAPCLQEHDRLRQDLLAYILLHPERFQKPRKHKVGTQGSYGMSMDPPAVSVARHHYEALKSFADLNGYPELYSIEIRPVKSAILKLIGQGVCFPDILEYTPPGDNPKCSIAKSWLQQQFG